MQKPYIDKKRHVLKTITWRTIGTLDTLMLGWLISGSFRVGAAIGGFEVFTKMILYYFHERAWYKCKFGVKKSNLKEVATKFKNATIAIDFDGVIHRYSKGFQGLENAYDPPMPGVIDALDALEARGYRLIIVSSRPVPIIKEWLDRYELSEYFDDVSNTKHPAKYYIDDHAIRFDKNVPDTWKKIIEFIVEDDENE